MITQLIADTARVTRQPSIKVLTWERSSERKTVITLYEEEYMNQRKAVLKGTEQKNSATLSYHTEHQK